MRQMQPEAGPKSEPSVSYYSWPAVLLRYYQVFADEATVRERTISEWAFLSAPPCTIYTVVI
jgi:hypothetical protein